MVRQNFKLIQVAEHSERDKHEPHLLILGATLYIFE